MRRRAPDRAEAAIEGADEAGTRQKLRELEAEGIPVEIPAMSVLGLYVGLGPGMTDDEERKVRAVLQPRRLRSVRDRDTL